MFAHGKTYDIIVDDTVPVFKPVFDQSYPIMAEGMNGTMWGPILEKSYAKFLGSYQRIATGGVSS